MMSVPDAEPVRLQVQILGPLRVWRDGREVDAGPRAAVPAPVMGDHPGAVEQEEEHLGVPVVAREDLRTVAGRELAHASFASLSAGSIGRQSSGPGAISMPAWPSSC